jgi:transcriptional regulator with XRE-family HTH domain
MWYYAYAATRYFVWKECYLMQRSLAERLRVLRARKGLSLLAASERLGVDRHTLRDLELGQGRTPRYPTLAKIAEGYGVDVEELLEEPVPLAEAPTAGPDVARSEALRQWEQGHKAIARAIADAFGFSVADLTEEPPASLAEAPEEAGQPPHVSKERLEEHFEDVRWDEVNYLNWMISDFWRLALPDEKPQAHFVPEDIDSDRVRGFLEHALAAHNVFEPEEAERIKRGKAKKAALAR